MDDPRILPGNLDDPRFRRTEADADVGWSPPDDGWSPPDCELQWPEVIGALLESLPLLPERLFR